MSDVVALRPLGIGDILDEAFRIYRRNFGYLVGISLAALAPAALATVVLGALGAMAGGAAGVAIGAAIGGFLIALAGLVVFGALTHAIAELRRGRRPSIGAALGLGLRRSLPLFLLGLVMGVAIALLLLTIVGWIWVGVLWSVAFPALMIEETGVFGALGRSRQLVRGSWWRVFGALVLIWLISFVISFMIGLVGGLLSGLLAVAGDGAAITLIRTIVSTLFNVVAQALSQPFGVGALVLLYFDLRVRKEGLDLEERAESLLAAGAPPSVA